MKEIPVTKMSLHCFDKKGMGAMSMNLRFRKGFTLPSKPAEAYKAIKKKIGKWSCYTGKVAATYLDDRGDVVSFLFDSQRVESKAK